MITIQKVDNGWIVTDDSGITRSIYVFTEIESAMNHVFQGVTSYTQSRDKAVKIIDKEPPELA